VDVPALVMAGTDNALPRGAVEEMGATMPDAAAAPVGGGGQFSNLESPGAFNRVVDRFLRTL
jgi:pimeloyl-ACP methyl ester carboxylesterase